MTLYLSVLLFVGPVVVWAFVLWVLARRKPVPPLPICAEISTYRCGCQPRTAHPQIGAWPIACAEEKADWWFASEDQGNLCLWERRFDSRAAAEQALNERGWKVVPQWIRAV